MQCAGVVRADAEVVECGIDQAHSAFSVRHGLLIDQGQKTCPAWRGKARAAVAGDETAIDHGGIVEIRFRRNIRRIAQGRRALIRRIDDARELLPAGNRRAAHIATAALRPAGFCRPRPARTRRRQLGATDLGDVRINCGKVIGRAIELAVIAARADERLALCRKLLEYRIVTRCIRRIPAPRGTEHLGDVVGRHLIEDLGVARAFIEKNLRDPRCHADRVHDIEHLLAVITGGTRGRTHPGAGAAESADQYVRDGYA